MTPLDAYIRVSDVRGRKGESFISPDVQREQIFAWAASRGASLGEVFVELDESGGRADRPLLMRAIERVEAGLSEGVAVAKLDRFG
ncbi:MAG TPA: recombinase family protein, partial [Solirubrobacterales bacterium]|nr:recombinase family protein [Solirubrobacterales bacterium]